jgi:endonuclease/exonuclease/phosphatase family metal-dependent hydrolase
VALSLANLAVVAGLAAAIHCLPEGNWITAAATYLPRSPYLAPPVVLLVVSVLARHKCAWVNAAACVCVVSLVMGLALPYEKHFSTIPAEGGLKIVSYNVQRFQPNFSAALQEAGSVNPDVVCLQECPEEHPLLATFFKGWHSVHVDEYWIGSRYPLKLIGQCESAAFERIAAIAVDVDAPQGRFRLFNVHQTTARSGLAGLRPRPLIEGEGQIQQKNHARLREEEAGAVRIFVSDYSDMLPYLVAGDFNTPVESSLYRAFWSDLTNAFDVAGFGFGYTAPCSRHTVWPDDTPWARIDHVLTSPHWTPADCWVGSGNGSDHRLIAARVCLVHPVSPVAAPEPTEAAASAETDGLGIGTGGADSAGGL